MLTCVRRQLLASVDFTHSSASRPNAAVQPYSRYGSAVLIYFFGVDAIIVPGIAFLDRVHLRALAAVALLRNR